VAQIDNIAIALPEIILACGAMALLMLGAFTRKSRGELILWLAVLLLAVAAFFVANGSGTATTFSDSFIVDSFARMLKLLTLAGAAVALLMSVDYWREAGGLKFEYPVLILLAVTGMLMMISANDLIALYVGLELQSLALYVIAAFKRDSARSAEAGLKYFVLARSPQACCSMAHRSFTASPARRTSRLSPRPCSPQAPISGSSSASCS
jgi:NADH-quinone oxidoreductase subunit N